MKRTSRALFVEQSVRLLVEHFGQTLVRDALDKVSNSLSESLESSANSPSEISHHPLYPSVSRMLEELRQHDVDKFNLLSDFYLELKSRKVLPESQDIRQYAQLVGLKNIKGKSRLDLVRGLMRFLLELPVERLQVELKRAENVSEEQRKRGFSILTDKLLSDE